MNAGFDVSDVIRLPTPPTWLRWSAVVVVASGLFVASVLTPPSGGVPELGPLGLVGFDKWLHTVAYAALGGTLFLALAPLRRPTRAFVAAVVFAALYGVGIELVQAPLPARAADPTDALANTLGALLGGVTAHFGRRLVAPLVDARSHDDSTTPSE
ncbi:VanZ family protein [Halogranum rubrum]|nr:VanZ family protein [Halogranum rubrum]